MQKQGKVWGETHPLWCGNNVELHELRIIPSSYCSRHSHAAKYNRFYVLSGRITVTIWKPYGKGGTLQDMIELGPGESTTVAPGDMHQFRAIEPTHALELYWVTLDTEDIERETVGGKD